MADTSLSEKKIGLLIWQVSNYWQSKLRLILKNHSLSLNEYLILESLVILSSSFNVLSQNIISNFSGIDESVVSVNLKSLEIKKLIKRNIDKDNRKKVISLESSGNKLFNEIHPEISKQENILFDKLQGEKINFSNLLKLILGKKIRVKAKIL